MSYPATKKKLSDILIKLGVEDDRNKTEETLAVPGETFLNWINGQAI